MKLTTYHYPPFLMAMAHSDAVFGEQGTLQCHDPWPSAFYQSDCIEYNLEVSKEGAT